MEGNSQRAVSNNFWKMPSELFWLFGARAARVGYEREATEKRKPNESVHALVDDDREVAIARREYGTSVLIR